MPIKVVCLPNERVAYEIRRLFCQESRAVPVEGKNPLTETPFNQLLAEIAQCAFDEGRAYSKESSHAE